MTLKTTPLIERINRSLAQGDKLDINLIVNGAKSRELQGLTHLDFLALGRAISISDPQLHQAWRLSRSFFACDTVLPSERLAVWTGVLASGIEEDKLTAAITEAGANLTSEFCSMASLTRAVHPDAKVKALADWAMQHLEACTPT